MQNIYEEVELENQIKSNRSLIYITTHEEYRVLDTIQKISINREKPWNYVFWNISGNSITNSNLYKLDKNIDQLAILDWFSELVVEKDEFSILVLNDFYRFLSPDGAPGQVEIIAIRSLKNLIEKCNTERKCVILTGSKYFLPIDFEKLVYVFDWSLPNKRIINLKIIDLIDQAKNLENLIFDTDYTNQELEQITAAFLGLSLREIEMICTYFFITDDRLYPLKIASKKQSIIKKSGILEWIDIEYTLNHIGGLGNLKNWLHKRSDAFTDRAKNYGLPANPKGLLLIGVQGGGKSSAAKAIAGFWGLPLLRLDVGRIFSGIVGSSEENLRSVIKTAESVAPCIMWFDEIDKAFSNNNYSGDSGTSSRIFGTFLTWMQEKKSQVFIVATANEVKKLPPELIRKGRFDDIFFIDLPIEEERLEIWKIHLIQRNLEVNSFDLSTLVKLSDGFTGAEIEAAIEGAMYEGFSDNERKILTSDIVKELKESIPISVTMKEEIEELRNWAEKRARKASNINIHQIINDSQNNQEDELL